VGKFEPTIPGSFSYVHKSKGSSLEAFAECIDDDLLIQERRRCPQEFAGRKRV